MIQQLEGMSLQKNIFIILSLLKKLIFISKVIHFWLKEFHIRVALLLFFLRYCRKKIKNNTNTLTHRINTVFMVDKLSNN